MCGRYGFGREYCRLRALTLRARVEHHVQVEDVDRFPHFAAKRTALKLVDLDGFSGLRSVPRVSPLGYLAPGIDHRPGKYIGERHRAAHRIAAAP